MSVFLTAKQTKPLSTRLVRDHEPWEPRAYQKRSVDFLLHHNIAALFLDPGLGKTSIVLEAFRRLKLEGQAERMLVVAPLRVCQLVWRQEGRKWTQFRDLTFSLLHGPKKGERLKDDADVYLINPEGVPWLVKQFYQRHLPFDTLVIDELTRFKNHRAVRHKKLRKKLGNVRRRWGLTGTPSPRGYMDLFGQFLILDDGAALGRYITYYRDQYFSLGRNGFTYVLLPSGAERIEERIAPYVLRLSAADYLTLPPLIDNQIVVQPPPEALKKYRELKREMVLTVAGGVITGANSGAVYSKLKQMANGAVYLSESREKEYVVIHDAKLDALEELIEDLAGQPLLVAYEFEHDLERIRERLGKDTPTLTGVTGKKAEQIEAAWNRGELPVLLVHPASAGHGLNLQGANACNICWFSKPWDLEAYDQLIRRLLRSGNTATRIMNHALVVPGSMDETVEEALREKDTSQRRLLSALNAEIIRDEDDPEFTAADAAQPEEASMAKKLGFRGSSTREQEPERKVTPKGWGRRPSDDEDDDLPPVMEDMEEEDVMDEVSPKKAPKGWGRAASTDDDDDGEQEQRRAVSRKIRAPEPDEDEEEPAAVRALNAFPEEIAQKLSGDESEDEPAAVEKPKARRGRRKAAEPAEDVKAVKLEGKFEAGPPSAHPDVLPSYVPRPEDSMPVHVHIDAHAPPAVLAVIFENLAQSARDELSVRKAAHQK